MLMISENEFFHEIKCDRITSLYGIHDIFITLTIHLYTHQHKTDNTNSAHLINSDNVIVHCAVVENQIL